MTNNKKPVFGFTSCSTDSGRYNNNNNMCAVHAQDLVLDGTTSGSGAYYIMLHSAQVYDCIHCAMILFDMLYELRRLKL